MFRSAALNNFSRLKLQDTFFLENSAYFAADARIFCGLGGSLDLAEHTGGVSEAFLIHAELVEHAEVEIGQRNVISEFHVSAGLEGTTAVSGKDDGQVVMVVAVSIRNPAAIHDHRVVQERFSIDILGGFHPFEEIRELGEVEFVDLGDLVRFF